MTIERLSFFELEIPYALSFLGYHQIDAYVPGIDDLVYGNEKLGIMSASEKIRRGKEAVAALAAYKEAKKEGNLELAQEAREI